MNYIIVDLEATCWNDHTLKRQNEIIEIGAVKLNDKGLAIGEFSKFVQPKLNPVLSDFCTELTTISQEMVDNAESFPLVIKQFWDWIDLNESYLLCSWGFYDKKQFANDCDLYDISKSWLNKHISIKHQYAAINNLKKPLGMSAALKKERMSLEGTHHRGIDDARNIAKIFAAYTNRWKF